MKKPAMLLMPALLFFMSTSAFAVNKNQSLEFGRTLSRNATTDTDAAFYNPAGLAFIGGDGFYLQVANGTILQDRVTETDEFETFTGTDKYVGEIRSYLFPTVAAAYQIGRVTPFFHFGPIGGGAGGYFPDGKPDLHDKITTSAPYDMEFDGKQSTLGFTFGTAFKISEMISTAVGCRFSYYSAEYEGEVDNLDLSGYGVGTGDLDVSYDEEGYGHTFILGFDIRPVEKLNIGMKIEWSPVWKKKVKNDKVEASGYADNNAVEGIFAPLAIPGDKNNQEPFSLYLGAEYQLNDRLSAAFSVICEFHSLNDLTDDKQDDMHNNYFSGLSLEYIINDQFLVSGGYAYEAGKNEAENIESIDMGLPCHHFAVGGEYRLNEMFEFGLAYTYSQYVPRRDDNGWKYYYDYSHQIFVGVNFKI